MRASDGAFDSSRELVTVNIDTRNLAIGRHVVYVRGTDASGRPGTPSAIYFDVRPFKSAHDFDGDLRSDIVWRNASTGANQLWRSANNAAQIAMSSVAGNAWRVVQGDFDGDGKADLLWRNGSNGQNVIWRSGNSATTLAVTSVVNTAWRVAGVGDFDGDGKSDVFWRNASTGQNTIWRSANSATQTATATVSDLGWQVVGVGDFDGRRPQRRAVAEHPHGRELDLAARQCRKRPGAGRRDQHGVEGRRRRRFRQQRHVRHLLAQHSTGANTVWRAGNNATQMAVSTAGTAWTAAAIGDFDGNGAADVVWRNGSTGANVMWRGASSATPTAVATVGSQAWQIVPYENQP
jgi:hypothetical protein